VETQSNPLSVKDAFSLLKGAGYPRSYVEKLLPDWWDSSLLKTSSGALQFALFAKQRLGLEVNFSQSGDLEITDDPINVRFKHRKDTLAEELVVVKNLGKAAASIAMHTVKEYKPLPTTASGLRSYILRLTEKTNVDFESLLQICWTHGIPVIFLEALPQKAKRMTGMIVNRSGSPSILLGFRHQQRSRQLFVLAHEIGHLLLGHVGKNSLLIDEDLDSEKDTLNDTTETTLDREEKEADNFALELIRGEYKPSFDSLNGLEKPTELAIFAMQEGEKHGIDPGHLIVSYAFETYDWPTANLAIKFFDNTDGAVSLIKEYYLRYADLNNLSEDSSAYLLALQGF
jgi:hypothetical protein